MNSQQSITQDLELRLRQGRQWLESGDGLEFPGPLLRKRCTHIRLTDFLKDDGRVERNGLGFRVEIVSDKSSIKFQLNVRVKTSTSEGPIQRSNPYVVIYVVNQATRNEDEIFHEHFESPERYQKLRVLSTKDWYSNWIREGLATDSRKFFMPESQLP